MDDRGQRTNANQDQFNPAAHLRAAKGIANPVPTTLPVGTVLYRFGSNRAQGSKGSWWFGQESYDQIREFALIQRLSFAYAARVLAAVLHDYGEMTQLYSARTAKPLGAYVGRSSAQVGKAVSVRGAWVRKDMIAVPTIAATRPFLQYFIPGLHKSETADAVLAQRRLVRFVPPGESHMFGTKGAPKGALLQ